MLTRARSMVLLVAAIIVVVATVSAVSTRVGRRASDERAVKVTLVWTGANASIAWRIGPHQGDPDNQRSPFITTRDAPSGGPIVVWINKPKATISVVVASRTGPRAVTMTEDRRVTAVTFTGTVPP